MFGEEDPGAREGYDRALGVLFGSDPADSSLKEVAAFIMANPQARGMQPQEWPSLPGFPFDSVDLDPRELADLNRLLNYGMGIQ